MQKEITTIAKLLEYGPLVAITFYLLWRIEPTIKSMDKSIQLLTIVIAKLTSMDLESIRKDFLNGRT